LLYQVDAQAMIVHPYMSQLAQLLQQEPTLEVKTLKEIFLISKSADRRNEAQTLSRQLSNVMQQLGTLFIVLSSSLNTLQMGTTPSQGQVEPPGKYTCEMCR
jgi:hypothetical protein